MAGKSLVKIGNDEKHIKLRGVVKSALDGLKIKKSESYSDAIARLVKRRDYDIINGEIVSTGKLSMPEWAENNLPQTYQALRTVEDFQLPEDQDPSKIRKSESSIALMEIKHGLKEIEKTDPIAKDFSEKFADQEISEGMDFKRNEEIISSAIEDLRSPSLKERLKEEIERNEELLTHYRAIPTGVFGANMIQQNLKDAWESIRLSDEEAMKESLETLRGNQ